MTKRFLSVLSALTLVAMLAPLSVRIGAAEVNCHVPFAFSITGKPLPAGSYSVETLGAALVISGAKQHAIAMGTHTESLTPTDPMLVFEKAGDQYTLRQIWMVGGVGQEFRLSRREVDRRAAGAFQVERVVISAQ
jgi:hypothetical protein